MPDVGTGEERAFLVNLHDSRGKLQRMANWIPLLDPAGAAQIAGRYVYGVSRDAGVELRVLEDQTIEREFGWVFFYGPADESILLAGNAPFIIDRRLGSIRPTGTALPIETCIQTYEATGRTFPPGLPGYAVTIEGWEQGASEFGKIALTKLIRSARGYTLSEAKACTDDVTEGRDVILTFSTLD